MCVIRNIQFDDGNDLSAHFQEKHVDEFEFNDQNVKKPPQEMECGNYCVVIAIFNE